LAGNLDRGTGRQILQLNRMDFQFIGPENHRPRFVRGIGDLELFRQARILGKARVATDPVPPQLGTHG
jgi:hypothetical protein